MRFFIAITPDQRCSQVLSRFSRKLLASFPAGLLPTLTKNFHITLHFVGNIKEDRIASLKKICTDVAKRYSVEYTKLTEPGCFPESGPVQVIWVGVEKCPTLNGVFLDLKNALHSHSFRVDQRLFQPHITVARTGQFKQDNEMRSFLNHEKHFTQIPVRIDAIRLIESRLSCDGAEHLEVSRFNLRNDCL